MGSSGKYSLSWSDQERCSIVLGGVREAHRSEDFFDVTLFSDDGLDHRAHRVILGACSSFFSNIFKTTNTTDLSVFLAGISEGNLQAILDFIYTGQAEVDVRQLDSFTTAANSLKIKGLCTNEEEEVAVSVPVQNKSTDDLKEPPVKEHSVKLEPSDPCLNQLAEETSHKCKLCELVFSSKRGVTLHQTKQHNKNSQNTRDSIVNEGNPKIEGRSSISIGFPCDIYDCEYKARSKENLERHKKVFNHNEPKNMKGTCIEEPQFDCSKESAEDFEILENNLEHDIQNNENSEKAEVEKEISKTESPIKRSELGSNCSMCGLSFGRTRALVQHSIEAHGEPRPYKCGLCAYKSYRRHNLVIHNEHKHVTKQSSKNTIKRSADAVFAGLEFD